ncbi:hypothetical protein AgCh_025492 [Apium graveolens]
MMIACEIHSWDEASAKDDRVLAEYKAAKATSKHLFFPCIATVHPKCQTRPCPPNEDNPPDSRTGDPKLLGAKCRMTPKFPNEDTR